MKRKELENNLIKEGQSLIPNKIDCIYQKLGISFLDEKVNNSFIEQKIKKEGNILLENAKPDIVKKEDEWSAFYENKLEEEKHHFVPNIKNKLPLKRENPILAFFKKPATIAFSGTFAIAVICTSVVLSNALNRKGIVDDSDSVINNSTNNNTSADNSSNSSAIDTVILTGRSTVNFKVISGSGEYKPEVVYAVETTGYIDTSSLVAVNDSSKNILSAFSSTNTNQVKKLASNDSYTISSFTSKYLNIALNLGYIERKNSSQTNNIAISISYSKEDEAYYKSLLTELENYFNSFIYDNKVIAQFSVNNSESETSEDELTQLISQAYEICTNLFVDQNGEVNKILCFSTDFNDWLNKYSSYSIEEMRTYVDYLIQINEKISNDTNKYLFIERLSECSTIQARVDTLNTYYNKLSTIYSELSVNMDKVEMDEDGDMTRPDGKDDYDWDWWSDVGHGHKGANRLNDFDNYYDDEDDFNDDREDFVPPHLDKDYNQFIKELDELISRKDTLDTSNKKVVRKYLNDVRFYSKYLNDFYNDYSEYLDDKLEKLLDDLDKDEFNNGKPTHHEHDEEMPEGWDDEFDDWWNNKGHRH